MALQDDGPVRCDRACSVCSRAWEKGGPERGPPLGKLASARSRNVITAMRGVHDCRPSPDNYRTCSCEQVRAPASRHAPMTIVDAKLSRSQARAWHDFAPSSDYPTEHKRVNCIPCGGSLTSKPVRARISERIHSCAHDLEDPCTPVLL